MPVQPREARGADVTGFAFRGCKIDGSTLGQNGEGVLTYCTLGFSDIGSRRPVSLTTTRCGAMMISGRNRGSRDGFRVGRGQGPR